MIKKRKYVVYIILALLAITLFICSIMYINFWRYPNSVVVNSDVTGVKTYTEEELQKLMKDSSNEAVKELKETMRSYLVEGKGTLTMLKDLYEDEIVIVDDNKYLFIPIENNVKKHTYNLENFKSNDKGEIEYVEGENIKSKKGIDVSKYQGEIDWVKVKADGVEFAFIRLGYRGYGNALLVPDENFIKNIEGAINANIEVGVYFFSQAISTAEAIEEAEFVLNYIKDYQINYPVVFDTEEIINDSSRTENLTKEELTNICITFCERVKTEGYSPMIYANIKRYTTMLDLKKLENYEKWYAQYDSTPYYPYEFSIWQYSEKGYVDGINGMVDLNILLQ